MDRERCKHRLRRDTIDRAREWHAHDHSASNGQPGRDRHRQRDHYGQSAGAEFTPVANAGADHAVTDNDGNGTKSVTLNGSRSSDSDGSIVSYVWRDGATVVGTGATASVSLSVGAHTLTLQVTDNDGATATDSVVVTVNPFVHRRPASISVTSMEPRSGTRAAGRRL